MKKLKTIFKRLYRLITKPAMKILPGNIAFFLFLSIIPIITMIGLCASLFSISTDAISNFMQTYFPPAVSNILTPFLSGQGIDFNVIIFSITGFMLASNGPHAIIIATNNLYGSKESSYLKRRIKAFNMTILMVLLIIFMLAFLTFGNSIMNFLTTNIFGNQNSYIYYLYIFIKWPIAFFFIFFLVKIIYTMAPDERIKSCYVNRGAVFTTLGWSLVTFVFSYYATNIANYNRFYGNLSSIIILLMWVYIIAYILVIGMAINLETYHQNMEEISKNKIEDK